MDPYILKVNEELQECLGLDDQLELKVTYTPAESDTAMFGGNSNWRGPVWLCSKFNSDNKVLCVIQLWNWYNCCGFFITIPEMSL